MSDEELRRASDGSSEPPEVAATHTSDKRDEPRGAPSLPAFIGSYRVIRLLGEGGMGIVWEAEQASPRRNVAVKVVRQGHWVDEIHARMFRREAETLGRLKHPNIAAIYEAGHTDDGHDYFAMELVRGETLAEWLRRRLGPLTPREVELRLRVFRTIAEAVNYAHQRGVIHRDLKPSNIVMAAPDGPDGATAEPVVKVLDFGLARLTESESADHALMTRDGVVRGTIGYMSPEQARGDIETIDVRTDVYALGVILYEMLAGRRPHELSTLSFVDAVRIVTTKPAPRLGEVWRGTKRVDKDLETIAAKALEIEPDQRYGSAGALARDVDRYLASLPIVARPASGAYRARMFVRRHRLGVTAAAAIVVLLLAGTAGTTVGLVSALRSSRIAAERAADLETVVAFQAAQLANVDVARMGLNIRNELVADLRTELTTVHTPAPEAEATLAAFTGALARTNPTSTALGSLDKSLFDATLRAIETQFTKQPLVKARLLQVHADVLRDLGLLDRADGPQQQALQIRRAQLGEDARDTIASLGKSVDLLEAHSSHKDAEALGRTALDRAVRVLGPDDRTSIAILGRMALAIQFQGRMPEAERLLRERLERARAALGDDDKETMAASGDLVYVLQQLGRVDEAEPLARANLARCRRVLGNESPETLISINTLGFLLLGQRRFAEAEPLFRESLDGHRRVRGRDHPDTLILVANMAGLYAEQKRWADAELYDREAYEGFQRTLGPDHQYTNQLESNLGIVLANTGRADEAERLHWDAWQRARRVFGPTAPNAMRSAVYWGATEMKRGRFAETEARLAETEAAVRSDPHAHPGLHANLLTRLAQARLKLGRYGAAESALLEAERVRPESERTSPFGIETRKTLADLYGAWEKAEPGRHASQAARWLASAQAAK